MNDLIQALLRVEDECAGILLMAKFDPFGQTGIDEIREIHRNTVKSLKALVQLKTEEI
ncbi:hypothetical protein CPT_Merlin128 [Citrobacter phage Merlin]|uniref:Uncharacterized protein n=1 Tax=Citrobacter phage Merlin TaxID=1675602 RepID=A0A0K1LMR6_9CAUD|nr:hypothetical protein CPT_Merlin128 [Citrobacter phage Merlin]AKU43774.1 hypothetical protein CPT_Merlin128 [Citrobacter phage Merlin]